MENLKQTFEEGLQKKKVSARKMLIDLDINEPTYYRAVKLNKISLTNYRLICDYLGLENTEHTNTVKNESASNNVSEYWKGFVNELSKEIQQLKMENWSLRKELGKFKPVSFPPAYISMS